ncbi:MAG: hypothetical protein IJ261_03365 [Clostridia bacterium]|nr:hypothetical protein [Clostridia bacterium]
MNRIKKYLCLLLVLLFGVSVLCPAVSAFDSGKTYYVDSIDGSDSGDGLSKETAWKTLGPAISMGLFLEAGDSILFRKGGTYECAVTVSYNGTKDSPVVFSSYGEGDKPVLWTNERKEVFQFIDCSYITVSDIAITAPNGGGIWIDTINKTSEGITLDNIYFYGIQNYKVNSRDNLSAGAAAARAAVMVKGLPARSRYAVNDLTIKNCEIYDCANGISLWGSWNDEQAPWCENEEDIDPVFNTGVLVENCYFHEMDAEAIIVGICDGALVTNCRAINCCQGEGVDENGEILYFTAAMWFWGSVNSTIQYCEIAGQKNVGDGMAVDFDSYSHNCTYQYIYSHDNVRFMCNCPNYSGQHGNTVRYCLSVNDNGGRSRMAGSAGEYGFSFYNNTIINCGEFQMQYIHDSFVANNIIIPMEGAVVSYDLFQLGENNVFTNNCYYDVMTPLVDIGSLNTVPGFSGGDFTDRLSFELSGDSPLIGAGVKVDDDLEYDFFGNKITSNNIGCYGGNGTDAEYESESFFTKILRTVNDIMTVLRHEFDVIKEEIEELIDKRKQDTVVNA